MNSSLGTVKAISCAKKCFLLPYFEGSIHKGIKICSQFDYFVTVNLSSLS